MTEQPFDFDPEGTMTEQRKPYCPNCTSDGKCYDCALRDGEVKPFPEQPKREAWRDKMDEIEARPSNNPFTRALFGVSEVEEIVSVALSTQATELDRVKSELAEKANRVIWLSDENDLLREQLAAVRDGLRSLPRFEIDDMSAMESKDGDWVHIRDIDALLKEPT